MNFLNKYAFRPRRKTMSDLVAVKEECLTENLKERLNDEDLRPNLGGFLIKLFK